MSTLLLPSHTHTQPINQKKRTWVRRVKSHHDYIAHNIDRQQGVRILTVFLYLNDVVGGGGTSPNKAKKRPQNLFFS
jgi:tRNA nucleotidyltransferase (CCA-adding enzyme)